MAKPKSPYLWKGKTPTAKQLKILMRRDRVLDLREGGASIRQIAEHINRENTEKGEKTVAFQTIFNDLVAVLDDLHKSQTLKTKHMVVLQLRKLERAELAHFGKFLKAGTADEAEKYSRAMERIWKRYDNLAGIARPEKVELTGADGGPVEANIRVILPAGSGMEEQEA
jgi:hypothetical protein